MKKLARAVVVPVLALAFACGIALVASSGQIRSAAPVVATLRTVTVTVTSEQLKALNTTPLTLIPAQGANKVAFPVMVMATYQAGTVGYTYSGDADLVMSWEGNYENDGGFLLYIGILTSAGPATVPMNIFPSFSNVSNTQFPTQVDTPFTLTTAGGQLADGNGTLSLTILYYVYTVDN